MAEMCRTFSRNKNGVDKLQPQDAACNHVLKVRLSTFSAVMNYSVDTAGLKINIS